MMCVWERERERERDRQRDKKRDKKQKKYSNLDGEKVFFGAMPA